MKDLMSFGPDSPWVVGGYVRKTGDTMTGALLGTTNSEFGAIQPRDAYDAYWKFEELDLGAFGIYPMLVCYSSGPLGNVGGFRPAMIVQNTTGNPYIELLDATLQQVTLTGELDWDGLGNHRFNFGDDVYINGGLSFNGSLDLADAADITMGAGSNLVWDGGSYFDEFWDGGGYDIRLNSRNGDANSVPYCLYPTWHLSGGGTQYWDTVHAGTGDDYLWNFRQYTDVQLGTAGSGSFIITPSGAIIGGGFADKDYYLRFIGESNTGNITWMEDENRFQFDKDIFLETDKPLYFRDTALRIYSSNDGWVDIDADTKFDVSAPDSDFSGNITLVGELKGCRENFLGVKGSTAASAYLNVQPNVMSATVGYTARRPGSITGLSANLNVSVQGVQGNIEVQARVNDVNVYSIVIASNGVAVVSGYGTQARGTDTFAAGDLITMYINLGYDTFVGTVASTIANLEVVYNT